MSKEVGFLRCVGLLGVAALLLAGSSQAWARPYDEVNASGSLRVAVYADYPPFSSGKGEDVQGLDVELAAAIAKRLGVKVEYMILTAGESVDDDLRNGVWKGHYLGGGVADLMLHVPYDHLLAARNDNAVLFAPYFQEQLVVLTDPGQTGGSDLVAAFAEHKVGVELDSLSDQYLVGAYSGALRENVVHFANTTEAVAALRRGEVAGVMGTRSEIEGAVKLDRKKYHVGPMPMPGLIRTAWPIGMAVKVNAHDLANAIEPVLAGLAKDGSLAKLFTKYGLTYSPAPGE